MKMIGFQARFQQRQLQEKEQKLLALYEDQARQAYQRIGPGNGKVRYIYITLKSRKSFKYTGCKLCMNKIQYNLDLYD